MSQICGSTSARTTSIDQAATADPLAAARAEASDLNERLRSTTARLMWLRHGIRAEVTDLVHDGCLDPDDANDILRRLALPALRRTFHCDVDLPIAIDVSAVGDASALEQARRVLTEAIAVLAQVTFRREPDCFGIDAPHTFGDNEPHRLVHTTLPLTVTVTAVESRSVWPAAKRRLKTRLGRLPDIRIDVSTINGVVVRDEYRDEKDYIRVR